MSDREPEWVALVLCCIGPRTEADADRLRDCLSLEGFRFGELIEQAMRHRVLPRVSRVLQATASFDLVPLPLRGHIRDSLVVNAHRNRRQRELAVEVAETLRGAGVTFAFTKGLVLDLTVYGAESTRVMGDVDLMIAPADRERVDALFRGMGFVNGRYNRSTGQIDPLDRRTEVTYRLHPDHLPHFHRLADDPLRPCQTVDVANSLTWDSADWQIPTEAALARVEWMRCGDGELPRMEWSFGFLFLVLHLFREGWFVENVGEGRDVLLARFMDVYLTWTLREREIVQGGFSRLVREHRLEKPVAWALAHTDRVLGCDLLERTGLGGFADDEWLQSLRDLDGTLARCATDMPARLRARDRARLVVRTPAPPGKAAGPRGAARLAPGLVP